MSLVKKSNLITPFTKAFLTDFFNTDKFLNEDYYGIEKMPAVNIIETDKLYTLDVAVPGMKKDDFNIDITDGMITISAERNELSETKEKNYTRREFSCSSFSRSFLLPENVIEKEIDAEYKDGILHVLVPKKEIAVAPKRSIAVK